MAAVVYLCLRLTGFFAGGKCRSDAILAGRVAVITGANTGIGLETAIDFVRRGVSTLVLGCRYIYLVVLGASFIFSSVLRGDVFLCSVVRYLLLLLCSCSDLFWALFIFSKSIGMKSSFENFMCFAMS